MHATDLCRPVFARSMERMLPILMALAFMLAPLANHPLLAQGLDREDAIDAIVGSDVKTEQTTKEALTERVLAAIDNTPESSERVRKAFSLDTLELVFLPDIGNGNGQIEQAMQEHEQEIDALRDSVEGSAMFYHAVNSRDILLQDIVAVEFGDDNTVTIFVNGEEQ